MCYVNSSVFKMIFIFILENPHRGAARGVWGLSSFPLKLMCYINSWVINSVDFKNDLCFSFDMKTTSILVNKNILLSLLKGAFGKERVGVEKG